MHDTCLVRHETRATFSILPMRDSYFPSLVLWMIPGMSIQVKNRTVDSYKSTLRPKEALVSSKLPGNSEKMSVKVIFMYLGTTIRR